MKIKDSTVSYRDEFLDSNTNEYQELAKVSKDELDKAYKLSSIKDNYLSTDLNGINKTSDGSDGVVLNMSLLLAAKEDISENLIKEELKKSLVSLRPLPTPSFIVAEIENVIDLNECSSDEYNDCDPAARCINTPGSYKCECKGDFTDMDPNLPGRICATEIKNCDMCHGRGDCIRSLDGETATCKCQRMYLGRNCEINGLCKYFISFFHLKKVDSNFIYFVFSFFVFFSSTYVTVLATLLPIGAIILIICLCCIIYCCRKYKKRSNYAKGFKNIVSFAPPTIGANTLDRKAMLETSSESSEHFRHVYDGPTSLTVSKSSLTQTKSWVNLKSIHFLQFCSLFFIVTNFRSIIMEVDLQEDIEET